MSCSQFPLGRSRQDKEPTEMAEGRQPWPGFPAQGRDAQGETLDRLPPTQGCPPLASCCASPALGGSRHAAGPGHTDAQE